MGHCRICCHELLHGDKSNNIHVGTGGFWTDADEAPVSVDWSIGTTPFGSEISSGTSILFNTHFGQALDYYEIYGSAFFINGHVAAGTYWFTLTDAVATTTFPDDKQVYWDENNGPSLAIQSAFHSHPAESIPSESFQLLGDSTAVPEPGSLALFCAGLGGISSVAWMKRKPKLTVQPAQSVC